MNDVVRDHTDLDPNDPLVRHLSALDIAEPQTLVSRVLSAQRIAVGRPNRRLRKGGLPLAAVFTLIAANAGASYFSPRYAQALADAPGAGLLTAPILEQAGLATTGAEPIDVSATNSGYTVRVFGVAADSVRTTLFVKIESADGLTALDGALNTPTLTDQFGHTYHLSGGYGTPVLPFEPLVGPAATLGARLTLHVDSISLPGAIGQPLNTVNGSWDLRLNASSAGGSDLSLPSSVLAGDTTYTFDAVRLTSSVLEVRWTVTGGAVEREQQLAETVGQYCKGGDTGAHPCSPPADVMSQLQAAHDAILSELLTDPQGVRIDPVYGSGHSVMQNEKAVSFERDAWYPVNGHGAYTFAVGPGGTSNDRTIDIP
jgi:hypothetical protein